MSRSKNFTSIFANFYYLLTGEETCSSVYIKFQFSFIDRDWGIPWLFGYWTTRESSSHFIKHFICLKTSSEYDEISISTTNKIYRLLYSNQDFEFEQRIPNVFVQRQNITGIHLYSNACIRGAVYKAEWSEECWITARIVGAEDRGLLEHVEIPTRILRRWRFRCDFYSQETLRVTKRVQLDFTAECREILTGPMQFYRTERNVLSVSRFLIGLGMINLGELAFNCASRLMIYLSRWKIRCW